MKRRHFLMASGLLGAGAYINQRGLRYPRLGFEPANPANRLARKSAQLDLQDLIVSGSADADQLDLRAIAPEPKLIISQLGKDVSHLKLKVNNIAPKAKLNVDADSSVNIHEQISGIDRIVEINQNTNQPTSLQWLLPDENRVKFAAIGDSGGGYELDWCLTRATQLDVDFLLHLGDFNYGEGEYRRAITQFKNASMPVYVSIGNHDFNDSGLIYQQFIDEIGPMNHSFVIAGTRFINVDTAVNFFPAYAGNRGELFKELRQSNQHVADSVAFTHKPFIDSREGHDHDISGMGEKAWLHKSMQHLDAKVLICGHVHLSTERHYKNLRQLTAGEGLGYEDILAQKLVSQMLIGTATRGTAVHYEWTALNMPWSMHTSPTHAQKLIKDKQIKQLEWLQKLLETESANPTQPLG